MDLITLDFETYYDREYSLSKMTTEEYIRDPRFQVIGVSTMVNNEEPVWVSGPASSILSHLRSLPWDNAMMLCQNTMFDGAILTWRCGLKPKALADTMLMSRAIYGVEVSHSLKAITERLGVGAKGTEVLNALGKRRTDFTEEQLAAYGQYCINDVALTHHAFHRFMGMGFPKQELKLIDLTLRMFTDPMLELDRAHLEKHLKEVTERKDTLLEVAGITDKKELMSNPKFAELLRGFGVVPPMKVSPTTGKETYAFAKSDEEFVALAEHADDRVQALVAARLGNKSTLEETRTQRFIDIAKRGSLPAPIRYYAAHTGRWGGSDKINLQNLPSRGPNAKQIKNSIVAPAGYTLIDADSAQIEARMLAWLAQQEDVVETFANNGDVYKMMASKIYGKAVDQIDKAERQIGKVVILGAGYGVGHNKLQAFLKMQAGVEVDLDEAKRIIDIYRNANNRISQLWKDADNAIRMMYQGTSVQFGRPGVLTVDASRSGIRLPSGLYIQYPDLQGDEGERGFQYHYAVRTGRNHIYGGKCLAGDTEVLTNRGWIRLHDVTRADRVWDGTQWVNHDGLIYQGEKATTIVNAVRMTPDHNVLTDRGWRCASSSEGLHRAGFWLPDGSEVSGDKWATLHVGLPVQLRDGSFSGGDRRREVRPAGWAPLLRVQSWGREQIARYVAAPGVLGMAVHAGPVPSTDAPSVAQLWRAGGQSMRSVGQVLRRLLGGHGADVSGRSDTGPQGQQWRLYPRELPVGDVRGAGGKSQDVVTRGPSQGPQGDGYFKVDPAVSLEPEPVYDLLNAGPNARFVVRGDAGPFIVHNCIENVTQALARCIIGEQMLKIAKRYRVVLTVHDSVVACVREEEAPEAQAYIEECMRWTPDWAEGLPVNCESEVGKRYGG
jgi:DNA polymerase I-like protein with 3'-5' exonuclease and polymerase domains